MFDGKRGFVTADIGELGEFAALDPRQHVGANPVQIVDLDCPDRPGKHPGKKGRCQRNRLLAQGGMDAQDLDFVGFGEAEARFGL